MKLNTEKFDRLKNLLRERILVLDGAMGSMIQSCSCGHHEDSLPDTLVRDNPELIRDIHRKYLSAGADIIETDSFNSNRFSLADYGLEDEAYALSKAAAQLAREVADEFTRQTPEKPRFVAGSVGPTKYMLSLAENESEINFDSLAAAYTEQINGLLDGGADIILLETVFDTLNVKSALYAIDLIQEERKIKIPVMVSCTVDNASGRLLSGQSVEAFYASVRHGNLLSVGINCGFGSDSILPFLRRLSEVADCAVSVYPNAGLPDDCGEYHEKPFDFSSNIRRSVEEGLVNIIGGCCGTTPDHIFFLSELATEYPPRKIPERRKGLILSNRDYADLSGSEEIIHVGERTNVAGSAKFARLVREKNFEEALDIAGAQIKNGARLLDVCMDDGMENAVSNMVTFLRMINSDGDAGSTPIMIDSSDWEVISAALKVCPGKSVVNSISLKDGEEEFLKKAVEIRRSGAAAVVMLFDERGQAEDYERKCEIAGRAHRLLTENGFAPEDIIFDPNVLTVGASLAENDPLALDFIKAVGWIKRNLPGVTVSGGISNLSFAFRGNNPLRKAMHTVFLYHAGKEGLDMAIVNPGMLSLYSEIEPELLELLEDVILCRKPNAVGNLVNHAEKMQQEKEEAGSGEKVVAEESEDTVKEKIAKALLKGKEGEIAALMEEAVKEKEPLQVIDDYLMPPMKKIGEMFGEGKMFLPQVIKCALVMKKAVGALQPFMKGQEFQRKDNSVIIATVKGDVHDIGKNIVGLVVSCNGYEVNDLGVRVEPETILQKIREIKPKALLLSGLISPSLNEMVKVCQLLEKEGIDLPVIIGGAATSEIHTAVRIAPVYSGPVFYSPDASANLKILSSLSETSIEENKNRQADLRDKYEKAREKNIVLGEEKVVKFDKKPEEVVSPVFLGVKVFEDVPLDEIERFIDWNWLIASLDVDRNPLNKTFAAKEEVKSRVKEDVARIFERIRNEKLLNVEGVIGVFEAERAGDEIQLWENDRPFTHLPFLRAENGMDKGSSPVDFLAEGKDYVALFAVSAGKGLEELVTKFTEEGDEYSAILSKLIADRLAEAAAEWLHDHISRELWPFAEKKDESVRIAFGYPAAPDHTLKRDVFNIMKVEESTGMRLTENSMIVPAESVCGIIFSKGEYLNVGKIGSRQLERYAAKRGISTEELIHLIPNNV